MINENSSQKVPKDEIKVLEIPDQSAIDKAKILIHSRKFRNYCDHELSEELDKIIRDLGLFQLQNRPTFHPTKVNFSFFRGFFLDY